MSQVCSIINACFIPFTEGLAPFREALRVGPLIMLSNAGVAFGLNVAAVFLIGAAGGLVLTLAGVVKVSLLPLVPELADRHRTFFSFLLACCSSAAQSRHYKSLVSHADLRWATLMPSRVFIGIGRIIGLQECFNQEMSISYRVICIHEHISSDKQALSRQVTGH